MLGVIEDVSRRTPSGFGAEGDAVYLLGETREELSGSEWAHVVHGHLGGLPPAVDLQAERALASLLHDGVGLLTTAHDLSDGGLAQALAEASLRHGVGVTVGVGDDAFVELFSESAARCLVTVRDDQSGPSRRWPAPSASPSAGSVPPAATPSPSTATSPSPSTSSVRPGASTLPEALGG